MADTELKIRVSAQMADAKAALADLTKAFGQLVTNSSQIGAVATAGFTRMEQQAERAAKASTDAAAATNRMAEAIDRLAAKARQPLPEPKIPKPPKTPVGEGVADQTAIARAALKQQLADLEASHRAGLTDTKAYYEQRAALQRAGLERELAAAKAAYAAATTQEARNRAATAQQILSTQLASVRVQLPPVQAPKAQLSEGTADANAVQRAALKQQLSDLDNSHKAGLISERNYWQQRQVIQQRALQVELATARAAHAAATSQQAKDRAATQVSILQASLKNAQQSFAAQKAAGGGGGLAGADMAGLLGKAKTAAVALGGVLATLGAAKAFFNLADQAKTLEARLRLSTSSAEEFATANARLYELAQRTRTDMGQVVDLYARFSTSTKELGVSQGELLRVTETVSKAIKISGGSAESANAAIIQLGQGLAAGTLRGEELNSVLEQAPRLAQAIAKGLGVTVGALKKMGSEGKISSEALLNALRNQADVIDAEFNQLPHTVGGAMTVIGNALIKVAGEFDKATGLSDAFAKALEATAPVIERAGSAISKAAAEFVAATKKSFEQLSASARAMNKDLEKAMGPPEVQKPGFFEQAWGFVTGPENWTPTLVAAARSAMAALRAELRTQAAQTQFEAKALNDALSGKGGAEAFQGLVSDLARNAGLVERDVRGIATDMVKAIEAGKDAGQAVVDAAAAADELAKKQLEIGARTGGKKGLGGAVDRREVERDALRQELEELKRQHAQALIATDEYYKKRLALQLRALDLEIAQERSQLGKATTADARSKSLTAIAVLENKRVEIIKAAGNEIYDAEVETTKRLAELRAQAAEEDGDLVKARTAQLTAQYAELRARLERDGNTGGVALVDQAVSRGGSKAGLEQLSADVDKVVAQFDRVEESSSNAVLTGNLSSAQAFIKVRDAASVALPQLADYRQQLALLAPTSKEAAEKLAEVDGAIARLQVRTQSGVQKALADLENELGRLQDSFASSATFALRDNLSTLFQDIITGSKKAGDALRDFAKNFAKAILQMMTQILATRAAQALLKGGAGLFGLLGTAAGGGGSTGASVKHGGGLVGAPGMSRTVPLSVFYGAPRLHTGGYLGSDEVPTILQRGEEVLSRSDPRNVKNQGAAGPSTVLVQLHPDHNHRTMRDWLESELARVAATS